MQCYIRAVKSIGWTPLAQPLGRSGGGGRDMCVCGDGRVVYMHTDSTLYCAWSLVVNPRPYNAASFLRANGRPNSIMIRVVAIEMALTYRQLVAVSDCALHALCVCQATSQYGSADLRPATTTTTATRYATLSRWNLRFLFRSQVITFNGNNTFIISPTTGKHNDTLLCTALEKISRHTVDHWNHETFVCDNDLERN